MTKENINFIKVQFDRIIREKGMTAYEVATKIGITSPAMFSLFKGDMRISNLQKIATALEVSIEKLVLPEIKENKVEDESGPMIVSEPALEMERETNLFFVNMRTENEQLKRELDIIRQLADSRQKIIEGLERELATAKEGNWAKPNYT